MKYIIIGLGNFGSSLGEILCKQGHEVIGVDSRQTLVEKLKETLTSTICLNSTEEMALRTLPLFDVDAVIVAIGEDWAASVQTTALLKKLGVKRIIGRSLSLLHETIVEAIGVSEIINPELEAAKRITGRLTSKKVVDQYTISENSSVMELNISKDMEGQTIGNLRFDAMGLKLLAIKRSVERDNIFGIKRDEKVTIENIDDNVVLVKGDHIVLFGNTDNFNKLLRAISDNNK